jgi:hypothetical protein
MCVTHIHVYPPRPTHTHTQGLEHPAAMLQRMKQLHEEFASKTALQKELRYPPAAGLPARMALMCVPLTGGVVTWQIKIVRLAYPITIGVCSPDPLQKWLGVGVEQYTVSLNPKP